MPRSIKRPRVGHIVWYYADATNVALPLAAMVIKTRLDIDKSTFDLAVFAAAGNALTAALATKFYDGTARPASGAFCTYVRVEENAAGAWPKDYNP